MKYHSSYWTRYLRHKQYVDLHMLGLYFCYK